MSFHSRWFLLRTDLTRVDTIAATCGEINHSGNAKNTIAVDERASAAHDREERGKLPVARGMESTSLLNLQVTCPPAHPGIDDGNIGSVENHAWTRVRRRFDISRVENRREGRELITEDATKECALAAQSDR